MTDQPYIQVGVADALSRIEAKLDAISNQMMLKADAAVVHELETRLRLVEVGMATTAAVGKALDRGRSAIWVAVGSLAATASSVGYMIVLARGH